MSPKTADPSVRLALIDTAARIVATEGPAALTLRHLANEVGTSTMAIYTHFGSMDELALQVRREGFARFRSRLASIAESKDPMADLTLLGAAYYASATASPNLYRSMFLDGPIDDEDLATGLDTFVYLVKAIERCQQSGRFPAARSTDPASMAVELWALTHGIVSLRLANLLPDTEAVEHLRSGARSLFLGWGDDPRKLRVSADRAQKRMNEVG
ncbi:MAG: TetR/AcrR family transcriptional regulator [Acidimicrobiales bacterium]